MNFQLKIWNQSSAYVEIFPEFSIKETLEKIWNFNRTPSGDHSVYTYATFKNWNIPLKFVPNSVATFINSLFMSQRQVQLEIFRGSNSSINSMMIVNLKTPFDQMQKPLDLWQGEIQLSDY